MRSVFEYFRKGFYISLIGMDILDEKTVFPFLSVFKIPNSVSDIGAMKIALISGPLYKKERERFWWLMR